MAKNTQNAAMITSKDKQGLLWVMPVGTSSQTDPKKPLPGAAKCIGIISSDGVKTAEETENETKVFDSDGDVVRNTAGTATRTLTFTIWEVRNADAMSLVYAEDEITANPDGTVKKIEDAGGTPKARKLVMEFETDTGQIGRRTYYNVSFKSRGEEQFNYENLAGREVTYTVNRDSETGKFFTEEVVDKEESDS